MEREVKALEGGCGVRDLLNEKLRYVAIDITLVHYRTKILTQRGPTLSPRIEHRAFCLYICSYLYLYSDLLDPLFPPLLLVFVLRYLKDHYLSLPTKYLSLCFSLSALLAKEIN